MDIPGFNNSSGNVSLLYDAGFERIVLEALLNFLNSPLVAFLPQNSTVVPTVRDFRLNVTFDHNSVGLCNVNHCHV